MGVANWRPVAAAAEDHHGNAYRATGGYLDI